MVYFMKDERYPFDSSGSGQQELPCRQDADEKMLFRGLGLVAASEDNPDSLIIGKPGSVLDGRLYQEEPGRPDLG